MEPEIHLLAGLNGSGKTTLARQLERTVPAARFSLDEWMLRLFEQRFDDEQYPARAERCRELIWDLAAQTIRTGSSVVLDWNMWSRSRRAEAVERAAALGVTCHLHHLVVSPETAIQRAEERADPHAHRLQAGDIRHLAGLFEPPEPTEGFVLHVMTGPSEEGPPVVITESPERPRVVCLCGSLRFQDLVAVERRRLTADGAIVLAPETISEELTPARRSALSSLHLRRIDLADEVRVVSEGGYLGPTTRHEIEYARARNKIISTTDPTLDLRADGRTTS